MRDATEHFHHSTNMSSSSAQLLDINDECYCLILCSDTHCIDDVHTLPPLGISDHSLVSFTLLLSIQHPSHTPPVDYSRPNFAKADWTGICSYLNAINWHSAFAGCNSVEQYRDVFYSAISVAIDTYVPLFNNTRHTVSPKLYPKNVRKLYCRRKGAVI